MIWLSLEQIKALGVSRGILHRNRNIWRFRKTGERGRNGKMLEEVLLESMPRQWQEKFIGTPAPLPATPEIEDTADVTAIPAAEEGVGRLADAERRLTEAIVRYEPATREAFLREANRLAEIIERYASVNPKRFVRPDGSRDYRPEVLQICDETACTDPLVLSVEPSRSKPKSPHSMDTLLTRYRAEGLAAFLRKPPTPTAGVDKRKAEISAGALQWIDANVRKFPSAEKLHQALKKEAARHGWKIPARGWVWRKYRDLPAIVKTIWYEGQKAYTGKFAPFVPRDYRDLDALQVLVGDHSVRDVTVMLPDGTLTRPWLTLWQDLRSGLIWGSHLDLTPSSATIGLAYVDGVRNFGAQPMYPGSERFSWLYTDQGKDYRCKQLTGHSIEFRDLTYEKAARIDGGMNVLCTQRNVGLMQELDLKHLMARGYNAREKMVERTHKDISEWEKNTFENEYCGRGIGHKPEQWKDSWHRHEKLRKKVGKNLDWLLSDSPFMTLADYRDAIAGWIVQYNHDTHKRATLGGSEVRPIDEYERLYTTRFEISEDALALLLMKAAKRKIGKDGVQFFQSHWFFMHPDMWEFKGQEIEIRYTDADWERVYAVLPNGKVVEAAAVGNSGVLNMNKRTAGLVAKQRAHEQKMVREFHFTQASNYRGETVEDRVAAQLIAAGEMPPPEAERVAVNDRPKVHSFHRFDGRLKGRSQPNVTADQVERANVIEGMFGRKEADEVRIKEPWEV